MIQNYSYLVIESGPENFRTLIMLWEFSTRKKIGGNVDVRKWKERAGKMKHDQQQLLFTCWTIWSLKLCDKSHHKKRFPCSVNQQSSKSLLNKWIYWTTINKTDEESISRWNSAIGKQ